MSIFHNNALVSSSGNQGGGGYEIERSLRFNSADSAYLNRTPGSAGNRKTWTWAGWVKRSRTGVSNTEILFQGGPGSGGNDNNYYLIRFDGSDRLDAITWNGAARKLTTQVFRDPSAWYHIVFAFDTTQATPANRQRLYINGAEVTIFTTDTAPTQNTDYGINAAVAHNIGREEYTGGTANAHFSGYLADIHFIDGQALTPSSFGEFDDNGVWQPIAYAGSYGTNGFRLDFSDNSAATATTLGKDRAGSNNWTPNNLSVTAGAGNDSLVDTPTSYGTDTGAGGEVRGNYATYNPLDTNATPTDGNLNCSHSSYNDAPVTVAISSGKWYMEGTCVNVGSRAVIGFTRASNSGKDHNAVDSYRIVYQDNGVIGRDGTGLSETTGLATYTTNDVIGVAIDIAAGTISFYKNGALVNTTTSLSVVGGTVWKWYTSGNGGASWAINAGFRPFAYTAPSGFKALCDTNLPAPVVAKPNEVMDVKLYTGNGSTQTISGLNFSPDWVWIKARNFVNDHKIYDIVRGATKVLESSNTSEESTDVNSLTAFNSDGFSLGTAGSTNANTTTYVAWTWDAGSSTVTNTQGSITSQVRANASAGFSVVTYTGAGSAATVGHGLGVAPSMVIVKNRNFSAGTNWQVYHASIGNTSSINLNTTGTPNSDIGWWNNTSPTSTVYSVGTYNAGSYNFVAYCFAPVAGYSSFGSYTGNGSADGPFVYTGFRPRYLLIKCSNGGFSWQLLDTARSDYNQANAILLPNNSSGELTYNGVDFLSNGFKLRSTSPNLNYSANTYVYYAAAEHPFQYARAR